MLTDVDCPAVWVKQGRARLGLSVRDLARLAGISYPTVSRIEHGHEQPRWDTIEKLFNVLGGTLPAGGGETRSVLRLADLCDARTFDATGTEHPDWVRFRALADQIVAHPKLVAQTIGPEPAPSGSSLIDNLLAAIAEKVADDTGIARPKWVRNRPPLDHPWTVIARPAKQAEAALSTPTQFARRGLNIPETTIWRNRETSRP